MSYGIENNKKRISAVNDMIYAARRGSVSRQSTNLVNVNGVLRGSSFKPNPTQSLT